MKTLQVVGPGCARCESLANTVEAAAKELGLECQLEKVTDPQQMARLGVMLTPALIVDGELKLSGQVPTREQVKALLQP